MLDVVGAGHKTSRRRAVEAADALRRVEGAPVPNLKPRRGLRGYGRSLWRRKPRRRHLGWIKIKDRHQELRTGYSARKSRSAIPSVATVCVMR